MWDVTDQKAFRKCENSRHTGTGEAPLLMKKDNSLGSIIFFIFTFLTFFSEDNIFHFKFLTYFTNANEMSFRAAAS